LYIKVAFSSLFFPFSAICLFCLPFTIFGPPGSKTGAVAVNRGKRVLSFFFGNIKKQVSSITDLFYLLPILTPKPKWGFVVDLRQKLPPGKSDAVCYIAGPQLYSLLGGL